MAQQGNYKKITAIVPAYNEAERIGRVLSILTTYPHFEKVIVVDDGSTDNTEGIVKQYPVRYVKSVINKGKGHAMDTGVTLSKGDIIFFADADVTGLTHGIIADILKPVVDGEVDMSIAMRNRTTYYLHYIIFFIPLLGGERALNKGLWQMLPTHYKRRFKVETGLNFYARYYGKGFTYKVFKGLSQVIKEKKFGLVEGLRRRLLLSLNVIAAQLQSQFVDIPRSARNNRISALVALQSLGGMLLGSLFFVAVYYGPRNFIYSIFARALLEDSSTPFVDFLLYVVRAVSINGLLIIGFCLVTVNLVAFLLAIKRLSFLSNGLLYKMRSKR